jgi:hypothetical protein
MGTVVVGDVFYDDNGNGIRDDNEKSPRYFQLRLFKCVQWGAAFGHSGSF